MELEYGDSWTLFERLGAAHRLSAIVDREEERLAVELPYVVRNYRSRWRAAHRLLTIADETNHPGLSTFMIRNRDESGSCYQPDMVPGRTNAAIGMATVQKLTGPGPLAGYTELSYWHAHSHRSEVNVAIGNAVIQQLKLRGLNGRDGLNDAFMVTLPEDEVKAEALANQNFVPEGDPQHYDLRDGVTAERQLWVPKS